MPNKKGSPAVRRLKRARRQAQRQREEERQQRQQQRRQNERQQERQRVNRIGLSTPKERRQRIENIHKNDKLTHKQKQTRIKLIHQARKTPNAIAVKSLMDLTPEERARRIEHIQRSEKLNQQQEALRIARIRASGHVGPPPTGPTHTGPGKGSVNNPQPLPGNKAENFEDLLQGEDLNAFRMIMLDFERLGLGRDLAGEVYKAIVHGITNVDMILDLVRQSDVYAKRFPGMAKRDPNLPPLSEAEYIDIEKQYRYIMETAGLPSGFYDSPQDFADFIGKDIGPQEFQGRVDVAQRVAQKVDPLQRQLLASYYGLGAGDLTAYFLDSKRALPVLQRQVEASGVAFYANQAGMLGNRQLGDFTDLVDLGVTEDEARSQYGAIAQTKDQLDKFDYLYDENYSRTDAEREGFLGDPEAAAKRQRLTANELATGSGRSRGMTGRGNRGLSY